MNNQGQKLLTKNKSTTLAFISGPKQYHIDSDSLNITRFYD